MRKVSIEAEHPPGLIPYLKEIIQYRDLIVVLAYRDLRIRYAQTFLGFSWAILQPSISLVIFTLVFHLSLSVRFLDIPYPVLALSGLTLWVYFAFVIHNAGISLLEAREMMQKVYFPRMILPLSKSLVAFSDLIINFLFLIGLMIFFQLPFPGRMLYLPLIVFGLYFFALGLGLWFSALSIHFRDIRQLIPFFVQLGTYLSPIAYPATYVPGEWRWLYFLNPMAGLIQSFRWALFNADWMDYNYYSFALIFFFFLSGFLYFNRVAIEATDVL